MQRRHVAAHLGHGLTLAVLLSLVSADVGAQAAQAIGGQTAGLTPPAQP